MQQRKILPIVCSAILLLTAISACSPQAPITTTQPSGQQAAEFDVGPVTVTPSVVMVGDTATVTAAVTNTGNIAGTYSAVFLVDSQQAGAQDITVAPGSSQAASFQFSKAAAGNYNLSIGNSGTSLTVYNWTPYTIQYDNSDGAVVGAYVDGEAGHLVQFSPPNKAFKIQKIMIFAATKIADTAELNNTVTFRIWNKDASSLLWSQDVPWSQFLNGTWQGIKVPDIRVNDDFRVEVVTHSAVIGDPIDFASMIGVVVPPFNDGYRIFRFIWPVGVVQDAVLVGFDYPQSYLESPSPVNRPETRSGYSLNGKLFDPGQGRLEGIQWLIRVEGEGAPGS
jgi:hypothetical protein